MAKVLVTGGAGFVGSSLSEQLIKRGDTVLAIDNFSDYYSPERKRENVKPLLNEENYKLVEGDFTSRELLAELFNDFKPDVIAHMGAMANVRYSVKNPGIFIDVNIVGTNNLLEEAVKHNVKNFVFASTSSVYGQRQDVPFKETDVCDKPLAPYPASKKSGELLGHAYHNMHGLNFTALRFFNVYGPKGRPDMMPYMVTENILNNNEITLFNAGNMERDWTYVDDIVSGVILALDKPLGYEVLNIGRGEPSSMVTFMEIMQEALGEAKIVNVDAPASEPKITYAEITKAKELLGYDPQTSLKQGLLNFIEWHKANIIN